MRHPHSKPGCLYFSVSPSWYSVIGDLGQPDWDYRPIADVPAESAYAVYDPYHPLPYAQHVLKEQGQEENPKHLYVLPFEGVE